MTAQLIIPPSSLVPALTRLVGSGLSGEALQAALAQAYTAFLRSLSVGTMASGEGLTVGELAAAISSQSPKAASLSSYVKTTLEGAKTLTELAEASYSTYMRRLLDAATRQSLKKLAATATVEVLEVAVAETAAGAVVRGGTRFVIRRVLVGALGVVGMALTVWWLGSLAWGLIRPSGGPKPTPAGRPCPELVYERRKCPWTPDGYGVEPCGPGFCWDGGPQGALACKQEKSVPNSGRTYTTDLVCNDGYVAERDPCTNVILRCKKQ
jgi:hypothetical protein